MSSDAPGPRPRQVTLGGWGVAVASAMLVVAVFDRMTALQSVDTRESLTKALTTGAAEGLGITVDDALSIMRVALYVAGTAAAVTAILGLFVLQRHAAARVALTLAAVPVVLTTPFAGGVLGLVVGAGTALLWSRPARDWFAGRAPSQPALPVAHRPEPERERVHVAPSHSAPPSHDAWTPPPPPPTPGWGQQPTAPAWPAPVQAAALRAGEVPRPVRIACALTWVFGLMTGVLYALVGLGVLADRDGVLDLLRDNPTVRDSNLSDDQLVVLIVVVSALIALWCLAACLLAFLTWRRHAWARILLMVSTGVALALELAAFPFSLLHLVASVTALRMLLVAPTRAWFRGPGGPPPGWGPPTWPPPGQQPPGEQSPGESPGEQPPGGKPPVW